MKQFVTRNRPGTAEAQRLSEPEFRSRMQLNEAECEMLDRIASGDPPRNAASIMAAIRLKCESAYSKQVQPVRIEENVTYVARLQDGDPRPPALTAVPAPGIQ